MFAISSEMLPWMITIFLMDAAFGLLFIGSSLAVALHFAKWEMRCIKAKGNTDEWRKFMEEKFKPARPKIFQIAGYLIILLMVVVVFLEEVLFRSPLLFFGGFSAVSYTAMAVSAILFGLIHWRNISINEEREEVQKVIQASLGLSRWQYYESDNVIVRHVEEVLSSEEFSRYIRIKKILLISAAALSGLLWGWLTLQTGSLLPAIILHGGWNLLVVSCASLLSLFQYRRFKRGQVGSLIN